jgi:hypothetical protein
MRSARVAASASLVVKAGDDGVVRGNLRAAGCPPAALELESSSNTHEIRPPIPQAPGAGDRRRIGLALIRLQIETEIHATDVSRVRQ